MNWNHLGTRLQEAAEEEGWKFHPPCTPDSISAFESTHGISIPEPYRRFLCEVSSGVVTDCMVLGPFESAIAELEAPLCHPFPYSSAYGDLILARLKQGEPLHAVMSHPEIAQVQKRGLPAGCLVIGELDGARSVLVITGEERGYIWTIGDFDLPETAASHSKGGGDARLDFEQWFDCWLTENGLHFD